jgi:hypothetical protein
MLPINRLREYIAETVTVLLDDDGNKLFNYSTMILDNSELSKILKERAAEENTFLIAVMPQYDLKGAEDNAKWNNQLMFFVLDKTDYSELNHEDYLNLFAATQIKAQALVYKMLEDKSESGRFCGILSWLNEDSIGVSPVWKNNSCNGWLITVSLDSRL